MKDFEGPKIAYELHLVPPINLMKEEGIDVLDEWFRWAEEWSMILEIYAKITMKSAVLEIGCRLGRIAFPLRYVLLNGLYEGFEICRYKIDFLQENFHAAYPNFNFILADIKNTFYNPHGKFSASDYRFPYDNIFAIADRDNPEKLTAYRLCFVERLADQAGLTLIGPPLPGL